MPHDFYYVDFTSQDGTLRGVVLHASSWENALDRIKQIYGKIKNEHVELARGDIKNLSSIVEPDTEPDTILVIYERKLQ